MAGFNIEGTQTFRFPPFNGARLLLASPTTGIKPFSFSKSPNNVAPDVLPHPISGFFNEPIRRAVAIRFNLSPGYKPLFAKHFPGVGKGEPITFEMIANAVAEFEISQTFATAPIDRFARGETAAMSLDQKRGALLFFGKAGCVQCHAVSGNSNEMFSDFDMHVIGVPQIAPVPDSRDAADSLPVTGGVNGNVPFKGPGRNEDFGLEDTGRTVDRYRFRTSPLRNAAVQPTFGHNGAWTRLSDVIRHHLDPKRFARAYDPKAAGVADDLQKNVGPIDPVLKRLSPLLSEPIVLTDAEVNQLVAFVGDGLLIRVRGRLS
jgi:cytochrome c peroxidase